MALRYLALFIFLLPMTTMTANAQQSSEGHCSPNVNNTTGNVVLDLNCPITVSQSYIYALEDSAAAAMASHYDVTVAAVHNFFDRLGYERVPPFQAAARFEELVREITKMRDEVLGIEAWGQAANLRQQVIIAISDGEIEQARKLLTDIIELLDPNLSQALNEIRDIVRLRRQKGHADLLLYDYPAAVKVFQEAIPLLPAKFTIDHARLRVDLAKATYLQGGTAQEMEPLAADAVARTNDLIDLAPTLRLEALGSMLRVHYLNASGAEAVELFDTEIAPLLDRIEVRAHQEALFCFACLGSALISAGQTDKAIEILERGRDFGTSFIHPDPHALSSIYFNLASLRTDNDEWEDLLQEAERQLLIAFPNRNHPDFANFLILESRWLADKDAALDAALDAAMIRISTLGAGGLDNRILSGILFEDFSVAMKQDTLKMQGRLRPDAKWQAGLSSIQAKLADVVPAQSLPSTLTAFDINVANSLLESGYDQAAINQLKAGLKHQSLSGGPTKFTGRIHFNLAGYYLRTGLGTPDDILYHYKTALPLYEEFEGFLSQYAFDVRDALVYFLGRTGKDQDARAIIADFETRCDASCPGHWQVARLFQALEE